MSFFQNLKNMAKNAEWAIEDLSRKRGNLNMKMELFVASYKAQTGHDVVHAAIPISSQRPGYPKRRNGYVTCYVRWVHEKGIRFLTGFTIERLLSFIQLNLPKKRAASIYLDRINYQKKLMHGSASEKLNLSMRTT